MARINSVGITIGRPASAAPATAKIEPDSQPAGTPMSPNAAPPPDMSALSSLSSLASLATLPLGLIGPVVEMMGTLGSGQFGDLDPTAMLGGVAQTMESAGQAVQRWARFWWFQPDALIDVRIGGKRWLVRQEQVRRAKAGKRG